MMMAQGAFPPVMDLGDKALCDTLRWSAQAFAFSDTERRTRLAPAVALLAGEVFAAIKREHPDTPPAGAKAARQGPAPPGRLPYADRDG